MNDSKESYQAIKDSLAEVSVWLPFAHEFYSLKENQAWVKKRPADWKKGTGYEFAIFDAKDGKMIGGCGLNGVDRMNRRANLGYWVRTSCTGRGVAAAATLLLAKWGFEALKLTRIEILVATGNERSLRVAEKAGARREGVLRNRIVIRDKPYDAIMHSLIPGDI
jgi:RimJ/RimL family protein N-acetyltransferase